MRACEHRHVRPLLGHVAQNGNELLQQGVVYVFECLAYGVRRGGVVDVLRCEPEVYELLDMRQACRIHLLLYKVLDGLDVVIGGFLYLLHAQSVLHGKVLIYGTQRGEVLLGDFGQLRQRQMTQGDEIFHLHHGAETNQRIFRKILFERRCRIPVASVHRRYCSDIAQFH